MNCKPGDLAIVVSSRIGENNIGKIVKCIKFYSDLDGPSWITHPCSSIFMGFLDSHLRPIRDNDGEDEMIRIAGKPEQHDQKISA